MAVAFDVASESHTGTTGNTNSASFNWTHTPSGTPRGVLVFVFQVGGASDFSTAVTYGSASLSAVSGGFAVDGSGEIGTCKAWFVGTGIPTGAQTVTVTRTNNGTTLYAVCITVTAAADTEKKGSAVLLQGDGTYTVQAVDSGADTALRFAGGYSGGSSVLAAGTGSTITSMQGIDFGVTTATTCRESTAGSGSRNVGFSFGTSDDRAAVHLAIGEVAGGPTPTRGRVSFAELEVPQVATRGRIAWAEFEVPSVATRGRVSFAELEVPQVPTRGSVSFAELEVPQVPTRGRVSWSELEVPNVPAAPTRGVSSWLELEAPDPPTPTRGRIAFAELELPALPTLARLAWLELEVPDVAAGESLAEGDTCSALMDWLRTVEHPRNENTLKRLRAHYNS